MVVSSSGSFDLTDGSSRVTSTAAPVDFSQSLGAGETTMEGHKLFSPDRHTSSGSDPSMDMDKYTAAFSGAQVQGDP